MNGKNLLTTLKSQKFRVGQAQGHLIQPLRGDSHMAEDLLAPKFSFLELQKMTYICVLDVTLGHYSQINQSLCKVDNYGVVVHEIQFILCNAPWQNCHRRKWSFSDLVLHTQICG